MPWSSTSSRISSATAIDGCVSFSSTAHCVEITAARRPHARWMRIMSWSEQETKSCCWETECWPASGSCWIEHLRDGFRRDLLVDGPVIVADVNASKSNDSTASARHSRSRLAVVLKIAGNHRVVGARP